MLGAPTAKSVVAASGSAPAKSQSAAFPAAAVCFVGIYNWAIWVSLMLLVLSQLLRTGWSWTADVTYGQSPLFGTCSISGFNDEPYSDRAIVCMHQGRHYNPVTVNDALEAAATQTIDTNGTSISGYRVVQRSQTAIDPAKYDQYANICDELYKTLDNIAAACSTLGYDVVRDGLRIVDDVDSVTTYHIQNALPVFIMPYWDNSVFSRYAVPGRDGSACMFRVQGRFYDDSTTFAYVIGIDRVARERRTVEWLEDPGGEWRNGWYEDTSGTA